MSRDPHSSAWHRGAAWFWSALDRLIYPPTLAAGGEDLRRARVTLYISLALGLVMLGPMFDHLSKDELPQTQLLGFMLVLNIVLLFATTRGLRAHVVGYVLGAAFVPVSALTVPYFDALFCPPAISLSVLPMLTVFISGTRAGLIFGACAALTHVFLGLSLPGDPAELRTSLIGLVGITAALTAMAITFETQRIRASELLRHERELARRASEAKSRFLANMSHEIRTPMNAVIGMTGLLLETELDAQQRSFTEVVRSSGEALLSLINDVLDFSKIEAGELRLENVPMSIRECAENSLEVLAITAAEKHIELSLRVEPSVPLAIHGDPTRLQQTLVNLIGNAVKFTERGEVAITVTTRDDARDDARDEEQVTIEFRVRDTGVGIRAENIDKLFDEFSQEDESTTRRFGGTGLGLTICKRLITAMGGELWVESELGVGSSFNFTIPGRLAPYVRPRHLDGESHALSERRVLIVDDNATNRDIVRLNVESWGMSPSCAASGAEALELLAGADRGFDCAILDMHMPEMDGLMLATKIRADPRGRELPLVMLTSLGQREQSPQMELFAEFLTKPVKASRLYNALLSILAPAEAVVDRSSIQAAVSATLGELPETLSILLAEDNANNQRVAKLSLQRIGLRADAVADGQEALAALRQRAYDVVLMDVHMPVLDGLEATAQIRKMPLARQPYIIAVTANATVEDRRRCIDAGMDDYISKPYRIRDLRRVLKKYTDDLEIAESSAEPSTAPKAEDPAVFNLDELDQLRELIGVDTGGNAELSRLIDEFLPNVHELIAETERASAAGAMPELKLSAHSLKSTSATLGAMQLSAAAERIEERVNRGEADGLDRLEEMVASLSPMMQRFVAALDRERERW